MPNLEFIADKYLDLDAQIKLLEKERAGVKELILGLDVEYLAGRERAINVVESIRLSLKTKAVQEEMGKEWWDERCGATLSTSLRICKKEL